MARIACPTCQHEVHYFEDLTEGTLSCPACGTILRGGPPVEQRPQAMVATPPEEERRVRAVQRIDRERAAALEPRRLLPEDLPRPLGDPLRLYQRFLSVVIVLQVLFVTVGCVIVTRDRAWQEFNWLTGNMAVFLWGLPFILSFWRILPGRAVNAFYLRSFRKDPRTVSIRNDAQAALGSGFRLSGIRDPRRRWPTVVRYLNAFIFALRNATPKYMSLEAGADWKARLWRSLGEARCALVDVTDLTPFVAEEIRLCYQCLGLDRILFIGNATKTVQVWKEEIAAAWSFDSLSEEEAARIRVVIWEESPQGRRAFRNEVRAFRNRLPSGTAGLRAETMPAVPTSDSLEEEIPTGGGWEWAEVVGGFFLSTLLVTALQMLRLVSAPLYLLVIFVALAFILLELWLLVLYVIDCGSNRERLLTVTTFGVAALWGVASLWGLLLSIQKVRGAAERAVAYNNLKQIGIAIHDFHGDVGFIPPARATGPIGRRNRPGPPVSWRVLILPYLENQSLYNLYRMDEPWDGPNNIKLLPLMPRVYSPTSNESSAQEGLTHWRVFVSRPNVWPCAAFEDDGRLPFTAFTDGTSQTILVVEASEAVPWTKPDELIYDPNHPLPPLGSHFGDYFPVLFGDASVRFLPRRIREETLRALITRNGGERVTDDDY